MQEQIDLILRYLEGVWRRRWLVLATAWFVAVLGWVVVYALPNTYQARIVMNINAYSAIDPLLQGIAVKLDAGDALVAVTRMMLSREKLESVAMESGFDPENHSRAELERRIAQLRDGIVIEDTGSRVTDPNARIYSISYQDPSPERAYQVVDKLSKVLVESSKSSGIRDIAVAEQFLDEQIADYEKRLTTAEQRLADFKRGNVGLMPDERGGYFNRLQNAMTAIESTRSEVQLASRRYDELEKQLKGETPLINNDTGSLLSRLRAAEDERANLLNRFTSQHPNVKEVERRIEELRTAIASGETEAAPAPIDITDARQAQFNPVYKELRVELSKAGVELESLKSRLSQQEKKAAELQRELNTVPDIEAQLSRLNRDYDVTRTRYLELVNRRESTRIAQHADATTRDTVFRIIEPVRMPITPAGPKRALFLSGVLGGAITVGIGLAVLLVLLRPTFHAPKDLKDVTELPVLGSVSLSMTPVAVKQRSFRTMLFMIMSVLLLGLYGAVLFYMDAGSAALRTVAGLG
ncbi:MAG: hypothetical protein LBV36_06225 [Chromatiales bacterium]|jgi:polysaccharide chain length determinant protein (PEP-CTERM system associated)|nr:hypothetical protein [Chromatiales bacterium]